MRALVQRVLEARVRVSGEVIGEIGPGLLVFLGVGRDDSDESAAHLSQRVARLRLFDDLSGKMNLSTGDASGGMLVVPQFTLYADTKKGNRPSFTDAASPDEARRLYEVFLVELRRSFSGKVAEGRFGADMKVSLVNDGPITLLLEG